MAEEKLVLSYLEITSCNNNKLKSNIVEIRKAVEDNAAITKDTLMKTFLTEIIDKQFSPIRLRLKERMISGENSPISSDSKEVSSGESSLDLSSYGSKPLDSKDLDSKEVGSGSYGSKEWMNIIISKKGTKIAWKSVFKEIFTAYADHDKEIKALRGIVLYMITN
jgi:hypothetical protein